MNHEMAVMFDEFGSPDLGICAVIKSLTIFEHLFESDMTEDQIIKSMDAIVTPRIAILPKHVDSRQSGQNAKSKQPYEDARARDVMTGKADRGSTYEGVY